MPALPNAPNVLRVDLKHSWANDIDILTRSFWLYSGAAPTVAGLNAMSTAIGTAWGTNLKSLANVSVNLTKVTVTDLSSTTSAQGTAATAIVGTRAGTGMAVGNCLQLNFSVARRYRGGKPRTYNPWGVAADLATSQTWSAAFRTACGTGWNNFATALIAAAPAGTTVTGQVNVSYYNGFTVVTNPVTHRARNVPTLRAAPVIDSVFAAQAAIPVASQRRRNRAGV